MSDVLTQLRSDLFWVRGYVEGGICAREVMIKNAIEELVPLIKQDAEYLYVLKDKLTAIIRWLDIEIEDESQTC